ncbi:MAG: PQQ-binding-like beta-propeller repeat protein, partial [Aliifodinibius sp.]|nr:PQQ-binding-like beta-propeller repeat protein [Fodinibius sp.]NIW79785.1 PQQ-binding-like beta-propeller repeat protein [Calditrichia bacterium]
DTVFFAGMDGTARALAAHTGEVIWKVEIGAVITTDLTMEGKSLYLGTDDQRIFHLDKTTGIIRKKMSLDGVPHRALLSSDGLLMFYINWAQPG